MTPDELERIIVQAGHKVSPMGRVDEFAVAFALDCHVSTVRDWRASNTGPRCVHLTRWWYGLDDLCAYFEKNSISD